MASGLIFAGQRTAIGIARAAEVRGDQLGLLVGCAAGPGPAGVIHVVGLGRAEHVEAAQRIERLDVLLDGGRNAILREQLADGAVLPFGGGAVVAPDVKDQRVLAIAEPVNLIHDPADLGIHVFGESGVHLHQPALKRLLVFGNRVPGSQVGRPRRQLRILRNPTHFLGALEDAFAVLVPAVVELAFVFVGPFLGDLVRAVRRRRWPNT